MHVPRRRTLLITPLAALAVATAGAPAMALAGGKSGDRPQSSGKSTDRGGGQSAGGGTGHRIR